MFSPDQRTIGGAFLIQQEVNGINRLIEQVKSQKSQYAPENIPPPFKKPSAPKFLTPDFKRIDPRYCVSSRPSSSTSVRRIVDKSMLTSRISNDVPTSFAYSLENRKRENEWKQRAKEQKEARRPSSARGREEARERRHTESAKKIFERRPDWDPTAQVANFNNHNKHQQANSAEFVAPAAETHGLKTLLANCSREEHQEHLKQKRVSNFMKRARLQYTGDGVAKFFKPEDEQMKHMLLTQLDRNPQLMQRSSRGFERAMTSKTSAFSLENAAPSNSNSSSLVSPSYYHNHHAAPGALVKEAAKRILQRVDCMGDRVSALHRENIAYSVSQIVPPSTSSSRQQHQNNVNSSYYDSNEHQKNAQSIFSRQMGEFDRLASQEKDFTDEDNNNNNVTDDENSPKQVQDRDEKSTSKHPTFVSSPDENTSEEEPDAGSLRRPSTATPPPPSNPTITTQSPTPQDTSTSTTREERKIAVLTYQDDDDDNENDQSKQEQPRKSSATLIPAPPPRRNSTGSASPEQEQEEASEEVVEQQQESSTSMKTHAPTRFVIG